MRRILVENARRKQRQKRGGDRQRVDLVEAALVVPPSDARLLRLNEALAAHILQREIGHPGFFAHLMDLQDVGML
jgi:hypothetical protein